jgi:hypothetical protein
MWTHTSNTPHIFTSWYLTSNLPHNTTSYSESAEFESQLKRLAIMTEVFGLISQSFEAKSGIVVTETKVSSLPFHLNTRILYRPTLRRCLIQGAGHSAHVV